MIGIVAVMALLAAAEGDAGGERLAQTLPAGFKNGFHAVQGAMTMDEYVPAAETVDNWSTMITVQSFKGAAYPTDQFLASIGERFAGACPGAMHNNVMTGKSNGYVTSVMVVRCPTNPATGKPENVFFRTIAGKDSFYVAQIAFRRQLTDADKALLGGYMRSVMACDAKVAGHPCP